MLELSKPGLGCLLWNEASIGSFLLPNRCGDRQCGSRAPTRPEPSIGHIVDDIKALISSFDFEVSN